MHRKTLKFIAFILLLFVIVYEFLMSDFNPMFENEDFVYLNNEIKEAQKEDLESIVMIYNRIHEKIKRKRHGKCACEIATNYIGPYRHGISLTKKVYIKKIEREFTDDDCLKFELLHIEFANGSVGIIDAAKSYFGKTIEQLNEDEIIIFVVMLENPSLYNPLRAKEKVMNKVRIYKRVLHEKT